MGKIQQNYRNINFVDQLASKKFMILIRWVLFPAKADSVKLHSNKSVVIEKSPLMGLF